MARRPHLPRPRLPHPRRRDREQSSTTVTVSRVQVGDVWARVSTIGSSGERPFVLVPGIGVSSDYFERLAPNLNEFGPVHALDLPGFAGVPHPGTAMSIRQYADLVGAAIDELRLHDPIVVGHSMGTQVVVDLAARRPEISTLVLIGPVVDPSARHVLTQGVRFLHAAWHEPGRVKVLALTAYLQCGFRWFSRILPAMMRYRIEDRLPLVQADTLVIRGEHDHVAPRGWVERCGELLPSSRLWEMPNAAHSVMHAHANEVAKLCVAHTEHRLDGDETTEVHEYEGAGPGDEREAFDPTLSDLVADVATRVQQSVAVARDDDEALGAAKTAHAEVMDRAYERRQDRDERG